jgi:hypothetical protein
MCKVLVYSKEPIRPNMGFLTVFSLVEVAALYDIYPHHIWTRCLVDLMIQETVPYPRACAAPPDRVSPSRYIAVIEETSHHP